MEAKWFFLSANTKIEVFLRLISDFRCSRYVNTDPHCQQSRLYLVKPVSVRVEFVNFVWIYRKKVDIVKTPLVCNHNPPYFFSRYCHDSKSRNTEHSSVK